MTLIKRTGWLAAVVMILAFLATPNTKAGPLLFSNAVALQNNGTRVDLFSNPGITLVGPQISFLVDITGTLPTGITNTLLITFGEAGSAPITQSFLIPAFGTIPPPFTQLFTFTSPNASFQGVEATLTIDILGSSPDFMIPSGPDAGRLVDSYTYSFRVIQPVPEPTTIILLGSGLLGAVLERRKRRSKQARVEGSN